MLIQKKLYLCVLFFVAVICIHNASAETRTATFDFTENNYGFPEVESASTTYNSTNMISEDTYISSSDELVSIVINPKKNSSGQGYGGINYLFAGVWRSDLKVLYYESKSDINFWANQDEVTIDKIIVTFDGEYNGTYGTDNNQVVNFFCKENYLYNKNTVGTYTLVDNIGTLELADSELSKVCWYCNVENNKLRIKRIDIEYITSTPTSVFNTVKSDYNVSSGTGTINVTGNYKTIDVYNIGGSLISKNEPNIYCHPGIYIVKVDGKAQKVIVK